ncbi:MAG: PepSY domain-containing protein [Jatrophihabitans sp.]|uniref:PepSY domain-containing protein n=1 Tax=Jatrophihabitans sp. TaxID=1932789 RepID=UPI003912EFFB
MTDEMLQPKPRRRTGLKVALLGAGLAAGAIGATALGASAQTSGTATTTQTTQTTAPTAPTAPTGASGPPAGAHGTGAGRSDEKVVTGALATQLKAAALKAVPGGTVDRVETDAGDGAYEAHMTKSDGTEVTVKFDKNDKLIGVEAGMGKGDPGGPRR